MVNYRYIKEILDSPFALGVDRSMSAFGKLSMLYYYMQEANLTRRKESVFIPPEEQSELFDIAISTLNRAYINLIIERNYNQGINELSNSLKHSLEERRKFDKYGVWEYDMFWNGLFNILSQMRGEHTMQPKFSKKAFENNLNSIDVVLSYCYTDKYDRLPKSASLNYVNFLIDAIKQEIVGSSRTDLLFPPDTDKELNVFPIVALTSTKLKDEDKAVEIPLNGKTIISFPYDTEKIVDATNDIYDGGFDSKVRNIYGTYFPELEMIIIENGRHHTAITNSFPKDAVAICNIYHLKDIVDEIDIFGNLWVNQIDRKRVPIEVVDMRYAVLYKLIQKRFEIEKELEDSSK